ncbi:MAG: endonuclease/exonuclease/phosphatase family protein [Candidatus Micrarchaeales archaeon]|jgi:endonuclease/exonuclease/phosphatase family metal-dependent hydrolase|uniref:Endonuclease/exonuclease/phosphatase n=1 Tax=Candidatus Micrarchaeum acidiphilum ARMAN-2 TaxID=425595 RepID=C7DG02_MICA2|nr:MAG: Endonuclease/exonuclease/phosphatase [Candidatus Micrarchaeum acidiphilum ARMAN-2]MCW6161455.1 endonuclease/exonuclease/phosphatase family protein [Candidatus Micrarchaeales archaeon]
MLKLLDLNIWLYNDWEARMPKIVNFIKEQKPDIVTLQEVMDDAKYNKYGDNTAKQIARAAGMDNCAFYLSGNLQKESPQWIGDRRARAGEAILSKYPLTKIVKKKLKRHPDDRHHRGIVKARVMSEPPIDIIVVHFSNNDLFSRLQMEEVLHYIRRARIRPVVVGDFNMYPKNIMQMVPEDYILSYALKKYVSFPSEGNTFDYMMIPRSMRFGSLECIDRGLSDHSALIAEISQ